MILKRIPIVLKNSMFLLLDLLHSKLKFTSKEILES